jgi:hypothetical protein
MGDRGIVKLYGTQILPEGSKLGSSLYQDETVGH